MSQRGETIVGISDEFKDSMPKLPMKGPPKTPLGEKVKLLDSENKILKEDLGKMQAMLNQMQATMMQWMSTHSVPSTPQTPQRKPRDAGLGKDQEDGK
jgi:hypothetical protein